EPAAIRQDRGARFRGPRQRRAARLRRLGRHVRRRDRVSLVVEGPASARRGAARRAGGRGLGRDRHPRREPPADMERQREGCLEHDVLADRAVPAGALHASAEAL
ncbi:MAG: hypothetical protein AVDCRST_MAG91-1514, partial [uncultured Sphingomonadaceae bacterium]